MAISISERQLPKQYENYIIDTDRLRQGMQDRDKKAAKSESYDTVDISEDGRTALDNKMLESIRAGKCVKVEGTISNVSPLLVFEEYENAVAAEKRDQTASGNFDRHVDKMVSAYQKMKRAIEEKYANQSGEQEQIYYVDSEKGIQKLTRESELELLDSAYEQHSRAMAGFTESMSRLRDFKPQIIYAHGHLKEDCQLTLTGARRTSPYSIHRSENRTDGQAATQSQTVSENSVKRKKGEIRDQAYQVFMSAINKGGTVSAGSELNSIWDYHANLR